MSDEKERAAEIDETIKKADAKKRADAEQQGEVLDKILVALDACTSGIGAMSKRMDAIETGMADSAKRKDDDEEKEIKSPGDPEKMKCDSRSDSEENLNELSCIQSRADTASSAWGTKTPTPWTNEKSEDYLRRTALQHKSHSPNWKDVNLRELKGQALKNAAEQIFSDSETASRSSDCVGAGRLRVTVKRNPDTGHIVREYYGDPMAWMERFTGGRRIAKFNLKSGNGGQ
jgi:hypothetical protein